MGLMVAIPQIRWTRPLAILACATLVLSIEARAQTPAVNAAAARTATLTADAVFGFGSSTLSTAGTDSLSSLFNSLGGPQHVVHITLVGHSDPLETRAHDPQLALARAAAIRALFVQQGVPADAIDVSGVADSEPAVGGCATSKAIECHAGDRRVELHALVRSDENRFGTVASTQAAAAPSQSATPGDPPAIPSAAPTTAPVASATTQIASAESEPPIVGSPVLTQGNEVLARRPADSAPTPGNQANRPLISAIPSSAASASATSAASVPKHSDDSAVGADVRNPDVPVQTPEPERSYPIEAAVGLGGNYNLTGGQSLENQVLGWAKRAGWGVSWNTPDDWTVPHDISFGGDFESAVTQVFKQLADNGADIRADIWRGNKEIVVDKAGSTQ